jgi:hypothetical protein
MDKWLNQLFMLLKSPVGEAEIPDVKPPLSVVDSQELGFFFTRYNKVGCGGDCPPLWGCSAQNSRGKFRKFWRRRIQDK